MAASAPRPRARSARPSLSSPTRSSAPTEPEGNAGRMRRALQNRASSSGCRERRARARPARRVGQAATGEASAMTLLAMQDQIMPALGRVRSILYEVQVQTEQTAIEQQRLADLDAAFGALQKAISTALGLDS